MHAHNNLWIVLLTRLYIGTQSFSLTVFASWESPAELRALLTVYNLFTFIFDVLTRRIAGSDRHLLQTAVAVGRQMECVYQQSLQKRGAIAPARYSRRPVCRM